MLLEENQILLMSFDSSNNISIKDNKKLIEPMMPSKQRKCKFIDEFPRLKEPPSEEYNMKIQRLLNSFHSPETLSPKKPGMVLFQFHYYEYY